jgi:hypothetical protein
MIKFIIECLHYVRVKLKLNRKAQLLRILNRNRSKSILEIGVDEGKNSLLMISTMLKNYTITSISYTGLDLFADQMTPEISQREASQLPKSKQYVESLIHSSFPNLNFHLYAGFSSELLVTLEGAFDFIFIDGGHSYETVKKDLELCQLLLAPDGVIVLDDYTNLNAEIHAGYGVARLVKELDRKKWKIKISKLPDFFWHDWGILITRLVVIKKLI